MGLRGIGAIRRSDLLSRDELHLYEKSWQEDGLTRAERVIRFVESLTVTSGILAGEKFTLGNWQKEVLRRWYATDENGNAKTRTGLLTVARKNGKTGLAAALALCHLLGPECEARGQIVVGASDTDQSGLIFDELEAYITSNPVFAVECNIIRHIKAIEHLPTKSKFRALSSSAKKTHGLAPTLVILDELAQWGYGTGRQLYDALTTAGGARKQSLTLIISTQSEDEHNIMTELVELARLGTDPGLAGFIYEIPAELDIYDELNWPLANPALGIFRSLEDMRSIARRAKLIPSTESAFRNLLCNQRVTNEERWIQPDEWRNCKRKDGISDDDLLTAGPCYGGLDLGSTQDLTALALFWPELGYLKTWSWCPEEKIQERSTNDRVPYPLWVQQGFLETTPGKATDKRVVANRIAELWNKYSPEEIAYDDWAINELMRILSEDGMPQLTFRPWRQGFRSMSPATKAFEERVLNRQLLHDGNPLLSWCLGNVRMETDAAGNVKPSKQRARERIDPVVAAIMAVGLATQSEGTKPKYQMYAL